MCSSARGMPGGCLGCDARGGMPAVGCLRSPAICFFGRPAQARCYRMGSCPVDTACDAPWLLQVWRRSVAARKATVARQVLSKNLFILHPVFREAILKVRGGSPEIEANACGGLHLTRSVHAWCAGCALCCVTRSAC
eukprot:232434-Pelagomonas_calceolata.AAC.4